MPKKQIGDVVDFGRRMAFLRTAAGFTQAELAEQTGVSRRLIAYYEGETRHPPTTILPRLAVALGVSTDRLLNGSSQSVAPPNSLDRRLKRKLLQLEKLEPKEKRQALQFLDLVIERGQLKRGT
jgi:transcriptional regulator with XRE-family HTH domain